MTKIFFDGDLVAILVAILASLVAISKYKNAPMSC
jgi:hypothetical protein